MRKSGVGAAGDAFLDLWTDRLFDALQGRLRIVLLLLAALLVVLPGQSSLPVTDRDEARFAQASKQMVETGDLIDIRLQEAPRWKKPAGIYWLQAASASVVGGAEAPIWAYRLPSALAALAAALAMLWAAVPFVERQAAGLAALMLATCVLFAAEANIAKTDAALMLTGVLTLGALGHLFLGAGGIGAALVLWIALAAAILLKGPIIPFIAVLSVAGFWIAKRPGLGVLRIWWGVPLMALLVLPWLIAIWQISNGAFFAESLGKDLAGKLAEGQEKHWGPPGLYALLVWGTFWPWAALIPLAAAWLWRQRREAWLILLASWVVPFWIVVEIVPTKLPHYVLPLYPGLAMALAAWVLAGEAPLGRLWRRVSAGLVAVPCLALGLALIALPIVIEGRLIAGALPLVLAAVALAFLAARAALAGKARAQVMASALSAVCLYPAILGLSLPALQTVFPSPRIAEAAAQWRPCAAGPLISAGYREPSLVFLTETRTQLAAPSVVAERLSEPGALLLIEERWWPLIAPSLPDGRPELIPRAELSYFNYNRGKTETATLYTSDDPRWDACANR